MSWWISCGDIRPRRPLPTLSPLRYTEGEFAMLIHISDHVRGRVDIVPGCCYVATEFVCAWFLPVLPRRSLLFCEDPDLEGGEMVLPVSFSLKSILYAYARPFFVFWVIVAATFPFIITMEPNALVKSGKQFEFLLFAAVFFAIPCLALLILWWTSVASPRRRARLAEIKGLPAFVVARLRALD